MRKVFAALVAVLAVLLVGAAPEAAAGPKPPSYRVLASYHYTNVPLVDDDGATRLFALSANVRQFSDGSVMVTCAYSVRGQDVTSTLRGPGQTYEHVGIYEPERTYQLTAAANDPRLPAGGADGYTRQELYDYCTNDERFLNPTQEREPDPTPAPDEAGYPTP